MSGSIWKIACGVLAVALAAFVAFEAGKRSRKGAVPAIREAGAKTVPAPSVPPAALSVPTSASSESAAVDRASSPPPEPRFEHAEMVVTIPRPPPTRELAAEPPAPGPTPALPEPETMHEKMARCLSFRAEDDEIHSVGRVVNTQVRVFVTNVCNFTFPGSDVAFEVRAIPRQGVGAAARQVGRFYGSPIEARGRAEIVFVLDCPACYKPAYRYEATLWRTAGESAE